MSPISATLPLARRSAGSRKVVALPQLAKVFPALFWLAVERAADAPGVTTPSRTYRRRALVSLSRAFLALIAVWVFVVVWPGTPSTVAGEDPRPLWHAAPVIAYLLSVGLVIDHAIARYGAAALLGSHLVGVAVFLPAMSAIALANPTVETSRYSEATLTMAPVWPLEFLVLVVASYAVVWLVPGSLPRQYRFVRDAWAVARQPESVLPHEPLPLTEARSEALVVSEA